MRRTVACGVLLSKRARQGARAEEINHTEMLKVIHAIVLREASDAKSLAVSGELESMRLGAAVKVVR